MPDSWTFVPRTPLNATLPDIVLPEAVPTFWMFCCPNVNCNTDPLIAPLLMGPAESVWLVKPPLTEPKHDNMPPETDPITLVPDWVNVNVAPTMLQENDTGPDKLLVLYDHWPETRLAGALVESLPQAPIATASANIVARFARQNVA